MIFLPPLPIIYYKNIEYGNEHLIDYIKGEFENGTSNRNNANLTARTSTIVNDRLYNSEQGYSNRRYDIETNDSNYRQELNNSSFYIFKLFAKF